MPELQAPLPAAAPPSGRRTSYAVQEGPLSHLLRTQVHGALGAPFDDAVELIESIPPPFPLLRRVHLWIKTGANAAVCLQAEYDTGFKCANRGVPDSDASHTTFDLLVGEFLIGLAGYQKSSSRTITAIRLYTSRGRMSRMYGTDGDGVKFQIAVPQGRVAVAFNGRQHENRLSAIGLVHVLVRTGNQTKTVKPQEPPVPDQAPAQQTASSKPIEHERTRAPKEAINDEPEKPKVMLESHLKTRDKPLDVESEEVKERPGSRAGLMKRIFGNKRTRPPQDPKLLNSRTKLDSAQSSSTIRAGAASPAVQSAQARRLAGELAKKEMKTKKTSELTKTSRNKSPNKSPALDPRSTRGRSPAVGERNKSPAVGAHGSRGSTPRGTSTPRGSATSSERVEVREKVGEKPSSRAAVPPQYTQSPSAKDADAVALAIERTTQNQRMISTAIAAGKEREPLGFSSGRNVSDVAPSRSSTSRSGNNEAKKGRSLLTKMQKKVKKAEDSRPSDGRSMPVPVSQRRLQEEQPQEEQHQRVSRCASPEMYEEEMDDLAYIAQAQMPREYSNEAEWNDISTAMRSRDELQLEQVPSPTKKEKKQSLLKKLQDKKSQRLAEGGEKKWYELFI